MSALDDYGTINDKCYDSMISGGRLPLTKDSTKYALKSLCKSLNLIKNMHWIMVKNDIQNMLGVANIIK